MQLHIVHPYTFKILNGELNVGPCEEFAKRDKRLNLLVQGFLDTGSGVVVHDLVGGGLSRVLLEAAAIRLDPMYAPLLDGRVQRISTNPWGLPVDDSYGGNGLTTHSEFCDIVEFPLCFIGGYFDRCLGNVAAYARGFDKRGICYVPELCVSVDDKKKQLMTVELAKRNVNPLCLEEVLSSL